MLKPRRAGSSCTKTSVGVLAPDLEERAKIRDRSHAAPGDCLGGWL